MHGVMLFLFLCSSDEDMDSPSGGKQFVELDSLDTEKALQLTDEDPLWVQSLVSDSIFNGLNIKMNIVLVDILFFFEEPSDFFVAIPIFPKSRHIVFHYIYLM